MSDTPARGERLRAGAGELRRKLDGPRFWRSLDELCATPEFLEWAGREFPEGASELHDPAGRREFMKVMGASLALAGLGSACTRQPEETILPYVRMPEEVVPGRPLFYASALLDRGYARGVLVESHEGRPTKIEGNPEHSASLGGSDVFMQAEILELYDPDRSQTITHLGEIRAWGAVLAALRSAYEAQKPAKGAGLRILTGCVTSPTLQRQLEELLFELPQAKWHQWEPLGRDNARAGAVLAFGEPLETHLRLEDADVIVSLDADFLGEGPERLRDTRAFARRRMVSGERAEMSRLYVVESALSLSGSMADHRLPMRSSDVEAFARGLGAALDVAGAGGAPEGLPATWAAAIAKDLRAHFARGVVIAGDSQPPAVHALAHAINEKLGNAGKTVYYTAPAAARSEGHVDSLRALTADMNAESVSLLLVLGVNPAYDAPADLKFAQAMDRVPLRVHLGLHENETSERCHWHVPAAHSLESWSDARAADGTASIVQPLIAPLYAGKTAHELLAAFSPRPERTSYELVREHWRRALMPAAAPARDKDAQKAADTRSAAEFDRLWNRALHDGIVAGTRLPEKTPRVTLGEWARAAAKAAAAGVEVTFRADPSVLDGRYANNGWLQELPKPITRITWENAIVLGPRTAERLGVALALPARGRSTVTDVLEITLGGVSVRGPAFILPGQAEDSLSLSLGYGRRRAGRVGTGIGFDAYALRTSTAHDFAIGAEVRKTGERVTIASTQEHWSIEQKADTAARERHLVRSVTVSEYDENPEAIAEMGEDPPATLTLYPKHKYEGHAWGMTIDMNACVGCNACVVACVSENNIPVVGKEMVAFGREMHWIRVDRYFAGDPQRPETLETYHQPVPCMQCEDAPCEVVCPVTATVHSDEGLNDMVYNRCVGTRYCSNNCPYKVRRFNFFLYQDWTTPSLALMRNPDVSVRSRGVMEKCTYCVQRINKVRIDANNEGRPIKDGEIKTACQQACPAEAIVFGDVNDPESRVSQLKRGKRNYGLLTELGTRPRTTYLGNVRNPNPELQHG